MVKPKLVSIYIYERLGNLWVDARFENEATENHMRTINVNFSLPKEDPRDVAEIEELATAKAKKFLKMTSGLMK